MSEFLTTAKVALAIAVCASPGLPALASPPLAPETRTGIGTALKSCTGGWIEAGKTPWRQIGPADLEPSLAGLARQSQELDAREGSNLYSIARVLLPEPAVVPSFIMDKGTSLQCKKRAEAAVALMRYLAGENADDWRGATNVFAWLGLAAEYGIGMAPDPALARRYHLRSRMHWPFMPAEKWSDGIDDDLIAIIERAGMRPYLEQLATIESVDRNGGAARMILADEALASDRGAARRWLRTPYIPALNRLIELEREGKIPTLHDDADNAFWARMWRALPGYRKWATRLVKGAELANGGPIPTLPVPVAVTQVRLATTTAHLDDGAQAMTMPIPVRALIDRQGKAIYLEDCRATPTSASTTVVNLSIRLDAIRIYDLDKLPRLGPVSGPGMPSYRWAVLPAIHFQRGGDDKIVVTFAALPMEQCRYSGMQDVPLAAPARMSPPARP